jgi:hut operon positive regulatory protein
MALSNERLIGKMAILGVLEESYLSQIEKQGWKYCIGKAGSMDSQKVVAAIETAAKNEKVIQTGIYRETHSLYHAIMEAFHGVTRGQVQLGTVLRTVGLRFIVVRGNPYEKKEEGDWIAVALYGTIGAPVKGLEHEAIGLGINHI